MLRHATTQTTTYAWKGRVFRAVTAGLSAVLAVKGMDANPSWMELGGMFTPQVVLGLVLVVVMAGTTSGLGRVSK